MKVLPLSLDKDDLFTPPFAKTEVRRFNGDPQVDGKGFEVGNGFWVVRVASYREVLGSKVPDWEIELMTGRHSRMVFPAWNKIAERSLTPVISQQFGFAAVSCGMQW